ncbi:tRNA threonylcarbamoyladenosine dehydratase [Treponema sp.]
MPDAFSRSELLLGPTALSILQDSRLAIFGLGGVGSFAAEALARSGIGSFILVDKDMVSLTNLNRQLVALHSTIGLPKVQVMRERMLDINPAAEIVAIQEFYDAQNASSILTGNLSYVVDAIDTISSKIDLIVRCRERGIPIISAMGAGNKLDPERLEIADLAVTSVCPLARVMRTELRKRGIHNVPVVYSREEPLKTENRERGRSPGSVPFVPSVAGLLLASRVVKDLVLKQL